MTAAIEAEYEQELLAEAERRVQLRVQPHTWLAYHETAVENRPSQEVASELGIRVTDVYVAKSRVIKMLRAEVQVIERASSAPNLDSPHVEQSRSQPPSARFAWASDGERRTPETCSEL